MNTQCHYFIEDRKGIELHVPIFRTNFHGPKDVRVIKVRLYIVMGKQGTECTFHRLLNIIQQQAKNRGIKYASSFIRKVDTVDSRYLEFQGTH